MSTDAQVKLWEKWFSMAVTQKTNESYAVIEEAATVLKDLIVERTPVGRPELWAYKAPSNYTPGTLKASWTIEQSPGYARIENLQPYAYRVETGWSSQAPTGMMRLSVLQWQDILNKVKSK